MVLNTFILVILCLLCSSYNSGMVLIYPKQMTPYTYNGVPQAPEIKRIVYEDITDIAEVSKIKLQPKSNLKAGNYKMEFEVMYDTIFLNECPKQENGSYDYSGDFYCYGFDLSDCDDIKDNNCYYTINPLSNANIICNSVSFTYNGLSHILEEHNAINSIGLAEGDQGFCSTLNAISCKDSKNYSNSSETFKDVIIYNEDNEDVTDSYVNLIVSGGITIDPLNLEIEINPFTKLYDNLDYLPNYNLDKISELPDEHEIVVEYNYLTGDGKNTGDHMIDISNIKVLKNKEDMTENFVFTIIKNILTIEPRSISIIAKSITKEYNGEVLSVPPGEYDLEGDGFVDEEGFDTSFVILTEGEIVFEGSVASKILEQDCSNNEKCKYMLSENTNPSNYNISIRDGELKIKKPSEIKIVYIDPVDSVFEYDGLLHYGEYKLNMDTTLYTGDNLECESGLTTSEIDICILDIQFIDLTKCKIMHDGKDVTDIGNYVMQQSNLEGQLIITKRKITVLSSSCSGVYSKDLDPLECHNYEIISGSLAEGQNIVATFTGTLTEYEKNGVDNTFTVTIVKNSGEDVSSNYDIELKYGKLIILRPIYIETSSAKKIYDGLPLISNDFKITQLSEYEIDPECVVTITGTRTEKGTSDNTFIFSCNGISDELEIGYHIKANLGKLEIELRPIYIASESTTEVYSGNSISRNVCIYDHWMNVDIHNAGIINGHKIICTFPEIERIDVGEYVNELTQDMVQIIEVNSNENVTENYKLELVSGKITITKKIASIKVGSATYKYDGNIHRMMEYKIVDGHNREIDLIPLFDLKNVIFKDYEAKDVGTVYPTLIYTDKENIYDKNYDLIIIPGRLTIEKAVVTLTASSTSREYNGEILRLNSLTSKGFADGEGIGSYVVSGGQLFVGTSANSILSYTLKPNTLADNYYIFSENGYLEVTEASHKITISTINITKIYDGTELNGNYECDNELQTGDNFVITMKNSLISVGEVKSEIKDVKIYHDFHDVTRNYKILYNNTGILKIVKRKVKVILDNIDNIYGQKDLELTYKLDNVFDNFIGNDAEDLIIKREPGSSPGFYEITAEFNNSNYEFSYEPAIYTIKQIEVKKDKNSNNEDVEIIASKGLNPLLTFSAIERQLNEYKKINLKETLGFNKKIIQIYDIILNYESKMVQPEIPLIIKILLKEKIKNKTDLYVVHIDDNNKAIDMGAIKKGNYMFFETTHLSTYAVVGVNFEWWEILIIIMVLFIILVVIIHISVFLKKNKKCFKKNKSKHLNNKGKDENIINDQVFKEKQGTFQEKSKESTADNNVKTKIESDVDKMSNKSASSPNGESDAAESLFYSLLTLDS